MTGARWTALRVLFLAAVAVGAWWTWRSSGEQLRDALQQVSAEYVLVGAGLVVCGLVCTGFVWRLALDSFGSSASTRGSVPPFFVAQLGKYIPGSVWSFAAQAAWGASREIPPRVPVAAAVLFLGIHVASGLVLAGLLGWWTFVPPEVVLLSLVGGLVGLVPAVYRLVGTRIAGRPCAWGVRRTFLGALAMVPAWGCYTAALVALTPQPTVSLALGLGCSFAVAFAAGVAVPVAPAGLGARDGVLLVLVSPVLGAGPAGVVVVLARLLHTFGDFVVAAGSWAVIRASGARRPSGAVRTHH